MLNARRSITLKCARTSITLNILKNYHADPAIPGINDFVGVVPSGA